jgi:tetratricopeptide (TPR) repeat protein
VDGNVQRASSCELQATLQLADSLTRTGQWVLAVGHYRWAGAQLTARGDVDAALAVYAVLGQLLPHCLHTQGMVAELHRRLGRLADAANMYERIAETHRAYARFLEAAHVYRLAVEIDPTSVPRRVRLAQLYAQLQLDRQAALQFEIAAEQLHAGDRVAEYVWVAERLLEVDPNHASTLRRLIAAHLRHGDVRGAATRLQQLLHACPRDDAGRELLADCWAAHRRPDLAAKVLRLLGDEVRRRGVHAYDDAKRLFVRAVQMHPHDRVAQACLRSLEAAIAEVAERDFADERVTGVIEDLTCAVREDEATNVVALRRTAVPELERPIPEGRVIYARFG